MSRHRDRVQGLLFEPLRVPEEVLVADTRSGVTSAELIARKLLYSLHGAPVSGSHMHRGGPHARGGTAVRPPPPEEGLPSRRHAHKEKAMRLIQQGDQVQVHYVKHFGDGSVVSSRDRTPTALTVGVDHPRLPGLGLALLGMAVGESRTVVLPAPGAYGPHEARKIHTLARARFAGSGPLSVGAWVRVWVRRHRRRLVRIVEISEEAVVIDANHRWAGQSVEMEVQVVAVHDPDAAPGAGHAVEGYAVDPGQGVREDHWLDDGGQQ